MKGNISVMLSALIHEIGEFKKATASDLKERWRALYGSEPPYQAPRRGDTHHSRGRQRSIKESGPRASEGGVAGEGLV